MTLSRDKMDKSKQKNTIVTLVGVRQAKIGFTFLQEEIPDICNDCRLFKVCMKNLEPERSYRVINVRDKTFTCGVHEEGARVVEVVEAEVKTCIDKKFVFEGGIITFKPQVCENWSCQSYRKCVPNGLKKGD